MAEADDKKPEDTYPLKMRYEELDKSGKVTRTVDAIAARRGDLKKTDVAKFAVYTKPFGDVRPMIGSHFTDEAGAKWTVKMVQRSSAKPEWFVECAKP